MLYQSQTGAPGSPGALAFFPGMVYIYRKRGEKMNVELSRKELEFICSALAPHAGRGKSRIKKKHKNFCEKLFTDLAFIASQDSVFADPDKFFK